jgi:uncharacterized membrane protein YhaH (DUF805 family)
MLVRQVWPWIVARTSTACRLPAPRRSRLHDDAGGVAAALQDGGVEAHGARLAQAAIRHKRVHRLENLAVQTPSRKLAWTSNMTQAATFGRRGPAPPTNAKMHASRQAPNGAPPAPAIVVESGERTVLQYVLWLLFSFKGRLKLAGYLNMRLAANLVLLLTVYGLGPPPLSAPLAAEEKYMILFGAVFFPITVLYFWTTLAMQVKRWHDRDKSWFWLFVGLIPFIGPWWVQVETC